MSSPDEHKHRAIVMLATGATQVEVAQECSVTDRTVRRWLAEPDFADAVEAQRDAMSRAVDARLRSLATRAIESLGQIVSYGLEDKDRIAAARVILDRVAPATQKHDVTGKVESMSREETEKRLAELGWRKGG